MLENGQQDTYENADTISLRDALEAVRSTVDSGRPPSDIPWRVDR